MQLAALMADFQNEDRRYQRHSYNEMPSSGMVARAPQCLKIIPKLSKKQKAKLKK